MVRKSGSDKSDLARIDKLRDEDIDHSDIPELKPDGYRTLS
jgi:hypothetical protein